MILNRIFFVLLMVTLGTICTGDLFAQENSEIDPSSEVTIGKVYLLGNKKTRDEIILRELDFEEGDVLTVAELSKKVELDQQKITNTRLFILVEIVPLFLDNGKAEILIRVQERWYIFPIPIFKLADRNFTEWWVNQKRDFSRVNYGLQVNHTNLTGRNDRFRVRAQFGFAQQYNVRYILPYINQEQTLGISTSATYTTAKTISYASSGHRQVFLESDDILRRNFSLSFGLTYRPSFFSRHGFGISYSGTRAAGEINQLTNNYLVNSGTTQRSIAFTYSFIVDKRDYVAYPLNGTYFQGVLTQNGIGLFNDISQLSSRITYARFGDFGKRFNTAHRISLYQNFSDNIPYVNRNGFGYRPDFVRGYERFVVESDFLFAYRGAFKIKVLEGVKALNKRSIIDQFRTLPYAFFFKVFADAGYAGDPLISTSNNFWNRDWIASIGIGIDIVTYYDFVMRFEYSINREGNTGFFFNFGSAF